MRISFLSAAVALTKSFTKLVDGSIKKDPYPLVSRFTSHSHDIDTVSELFKLIKEHSLKGHCLLKGELASDLVNESRKEHTSSEGETEWICLDFDRLTTGSVEEELTKMGIGDITHIIQYSSSQGMEGTEGTVSCHVFMLLSQPMRAPELKLWLQNLNFVHYADDVRLTRNHAALSFPVDITTCQNDKLLYIATPTFNGMRDPLKGERMTYVKGKHERLPTQRIGTISPEVIRQKYMAAKNVLRKALGLKATNAGTTFIGEHEVQNKPGEAVVTGIKDCGDFTRLNLNGGDSWAYWHPNNAFELLFNFKGEPAYRLKEMCPSYYADLVGKNALKTSTPTLGGELVLGFRDFHTAKYYNGTWHPETHRLNLSEARSEKQVEHYLLSHGLTPQAFIPIWTMTYNEKSDVIVDMDNNHINLFQPSKYMLEARVPAKPINLSKECPTIQRIVSHMLGDDPVVIKAFEQWFACIFQRKGKPKVSWVAHGDEGTGKGTWFDLIATPLLGARNVTKVDINTIEDRFNAWMKNKLFIMVEEIDVDDFKEKGRAAAIFKTRITENTFSCRDMRSTAYEYPNTFQFFFASNRPQPVFIPPGDRRYNVARYQAGKLLISDHERDYLIPKELEVYAAHLMSIETSVVLATQICDTEDRRAIAKLGVSSFQEIANALKQGDFQLIWDMMPDEKHTADINGLDTELAYMSAYAHMVKDIAKEIVASNEYFNTVKTKLSRDEIGTIFRYTIGKTVPTTSPNKLTSFLRHVNIQTQKVRKADKLIMGMEVKWVVSEALRKELTEYFNALKPKAVVRTIKPENSNENKKASRTGGV